jgi:uncharacterized membrane protein YesL
MRGVRIVGRGLHDTLEHLLPFTAVTLAWWVGVGLVVTAPAATLALFTHVDPRIGTAKDRPTTRETLSFIRAHFFQSWGLVILTAPLIVVLVINIATIRPGESSFGVLAPVWLFLLLIVTFITATAFAHVALLEFRVIDAVKQGALMTVAYFPRVLIVAILLWLLLVVGTVLVIPVVMFLPATFAATIVRFVFEAREIKVIDPLSPTDERMREEQRRRESKFGP